MVIIWKQVVSWLLVILYAVIFQFIQAHVPKTSWKRCRHMNTICCHLISFIIVSSRSLSDLLGWHNVLVNSTCMFKWPTTVMFICLICHISLCLIFLYLFMQFFIACYFWSRNMLQVLVFLKCLYPCSEWHSAYFYNLMLHYGLIQIFFSFL